MVGVSLIFFSPIISTSPIYASCVDRNNQLICRTTSPPYEDCVYVGTTRPCRGPAAATDNCECKEVTTPPSEREIPRRCQVGTPQEGIETALGCIPTKNTTGFIAWILKFAIGIGGGIAFILMLIGVFQIITSSGDPERLKAGKELITSALIGLLMIIFSLFLLQLIGVQILQIPGF